MKTSKNKAPAAGNSQGRNAKNLKPNYRTGAATNTQTTGELLRNFRQSVHDALGYAPVAVNPNGQVQRFSITGKRDDMTGWYVLHLNGSGHAAGAFGCWRKGIRQTWHSTNGSQRLSVQEWQAIQQAIAAERARATAARQAKAEQAHRQAVQMWLSSPPAHPGHLYLVRKKLQAGHFIRQQGNRLLIPVCDVDGALHGLQTIDTNGNKQFLAGTPKRGHFCLLGDRLHCTAGVFLCEGYATGASLYEAYRLPVLVAFDAGNLLPVAQAYRTRFPDTPLTVCADNDRKRPDNPGLTKAREVVACLPGVGLVVPEFPPHAPLDLSDFNDLAVLLGSNAYGDKAQ